MRISLVGIKKTAAAAAASPNKNNEYATELGRSNNGLLLGSHSEPPSSIHCED